MATLAVGPGAGSYSVDQSFFVKLAIALAGLTVTGFILNAAMGRVDISAIPVWIHLHAVAMLAWLALFIAQNRLAASGNIALHRKLGWAGAFLVCAIVGLTCFSGVMAVAMGRQPPFFSPPFFLALVEHFEKEHPGELAEALGIAVDAVVLAHDVLDGLDGAAEIHLVVLVSRGLMLDQACFSSFCS